MHQKKIIFAISALSLLVSCGGTKQQTLGQLEYEKEEEKPIVFEKMNHKEVREEYQELLDLFEDQQLKEQIERRIADVYMMEGVHRQNTESNPNKSYYIDAIKAYREVLEKYPNSPDNAEVLYQLAKAYDMEGQLDEALVMLERLTSRHPYYKNIAEAYFRKGDIYFSRQDYTRAEKAYTAVADSQVEKYIVNAYYMLGWTYYKQFRFRKSLQAFAYVLNNTLGEATDLDGLEKAQRTVVGDALHSTSLALDKQGGAPAIGTFPELADKPFVWLLYNDLGDYYLQKEIFEAAADSYRHFVNEFPGSKQAPTLHKSLVETYIKGSFPLQALVEKESYVAAYGIYSSYPGNTNGIREDLQPVIKTYLDELAQHNHAMGQTLFDSLKKEGDDKVPDKKRKGVKQDGLAALDKAANFYQEYIDTFPADKRVDEMRFLKAEALFLAGHYERAIKDYELVAYEPVGTSAQEHAANAGYAAIICFEKVISNYKEGSEQEKQWQAQAVESMLKFAAKFDADERSPVVLTNAAEYMFSLNQYQRAVDITTTLISENQALDKELKKTAYGIMAHSYFKLERYTDAEASYISQRNLVEVDGEEYNVITERLASAIYKNSEKIADSGDNATAADEFLRIKQLAPNSKVRATAQYDAVALLLGLENWTRAIPEILELQAKFPDHKMAVEFPRILAFAYEKSEQWALAAEAYMVVHKNDPDEDKKREALFYSADMQEKNKNHATAAKLFKRYAYQYEQPFDMRMEARYHTAINYKEMGDINKELYWLRRIVDGDKKGGSQRTDRSKWLAAWSNTEYGDYFAVEFNKTRLRLPLVKSLPKKNEFLQSAIQRYQSAADYGFLEFVTQSSYKIGNLYQIFTKELRNSPIPNGLSQNDKTMYMQIIEEQAAPFEQLAIEVHGANVSRLWEGEFNSWIEKSFEEMRVLNPERFDKQELIVSYGDEIR